MSESPSSELRESLSLMCLEPGESNETLNMDEPEKTMATVAHLIEQLHAKMSSPHDKELSTACLLDLANRRKEARTLIGSHAQAMPLFISILRNGTPSAKVNVAATLSALCKDKDLRLKVLLGGCIQPLLSLLNSGSAEARKSAAETIYEVSSGGLADDHVGMKIFITEGVVPTLWALLNPKKNQDKVVEGFVTGALRNLCGDKDSYWKVTLESGGVDIIVGLLSSDNPAAQSNAASLLARLMLAFGDSIPKVIESGAVEILLRLVGQNNNVSVRASAADALEAFSSKSAKAKKTVLEANGVHVLIGAIVAPSKECMQGEHGQVLQGHSTRALANICGGMSALIRYLGELSQSLCLAEQVADIIGTLAYALMIFEKNSSGNEESFDPAEIETVLVKLLRPPDTKKVQEHILEAMASLYGNTSLSKWLNHAETKRILIGLITMASFDVREHLILSLSRLCCDGVDIWDAIDEREGVQLLISFLGISSEQHQEYAVQLLAILTDQVDESKWAITAAGGIPPLVQLLETGSQKAREDAARILWDLCCHSEDIRACVESAGAVPALLWLLRNGGPRAQEASALALAKLLRKTDSVIINHLLALVISESPTSKAHVLRVLGHVLTTASYTDLIHKGSAANKGLSSLIQVLTSSNDETKEQAASVLADLFSTRHDICDSLEIDEILNPCMKLLTSNTQVVVTQLARTLGALSRSTSTANRKPYISEGDVKPLIKLAKTSSIDAAETAVAALANLLSDPQIAAEALAEDVVPALIRVLGEGTSEGKQNASQVLHQLLKHFPVSDVLNRNTQCCFVILALVDSLKALDMDKENAGETIEVVALLVKTKLGIDSSYPLWSALADVPSSLESLVRCLTDGPPLVQDKAIQILARLCADHPALLGISLIARSKSIGSLTSRIVNSPSLEVRVGGSALLICVAKEHKDKSMAELELCGYLEPLIYTLVDMMKQQSSYSSLAIEVCRPRGYMGKLAFETGNEFNIPDPAVVLGGTVALWLLIIISSFHMKNRHTVTEAGGLEVLYENLARNTSCFQAEFEDTEGIWVSVLLLVIMSQDASIIASPTTKRTIPLLACLLKSDEMIDRFFSAQVMASLVSHKSKDINLAIANSSAVVGLINLLGYLKSDVPNLVNISDEFSLVRNPEQVVLRNLFEVGDIRLGSTAHKSIPLLVDLLRPIPDRPCAPPVCVDLLTQIADGSDENKLLIAEAGALEALSKYLSLGPQDSIECTITELLRILFTNHDIIRYEAAHSTLNQLTAVLHLGSRSARYSSARALYDLFSVEKIKDSEIGRQAVQPLVDMLNNSSESEQEVAIAALIKLISRNFSKPAILVDMEGKTLENLYKILSSKSSLELKSDAGRLCSIIFCNSKIRANPVASQCIEHFVSLMRCQISVAVEAGVYAFEKLLEDKGQLELAAAYDVLDDLVGLVSGENHLLIGTCISALIKLGKDQILRKLQMVKAGIINKCLELLLRGAPSSLCFSIAELFRILTNTGAIAGSSDAAKMVEPLFYVLCRPDLSLQGQHHALQALVNILEKPQSLATLNLTPSEIITPLISILESPSQPIQLLGSELLTHLLAQKHFQHDITTKKAVVPLVRLTGIGIVNLQQTAIKALEKISVSWPQAVADAGVIFELSKVVDQESPEQLRSLWESAAFVLCNVLRFKAEYYFKIRVEVLVKMLCSTSESTILMAINALIGLQKSDASCAEQIADAGAINALLELLRSHQCEAAAAILLEALFNNVRVREMKITRNAIAPLSQYLLDPLTKSDSNRLLAALALGDLSQDERLARARDSAHACRALISLLEEQPTEEMKMVAICALQNFVIRSRTNKRAVAESGGILLIQELLLSCNADVSSQAALLIKFLFSDHSLQEYVSNELIRSLTAALERELWSTDTINEEVLRTLTVIFTNFSKLRASEAASLSIPHLIGALKADSETAQESVLEILYMLRHSWPEMPIDIAKSQAVITAEAIPILQLLMKTWPPRFQEKADSLLHCLPGCLTVTIKRGNNLKHSMGTTNAFCCLTIGNAPARQTKVVNRSSSPEWNEGFTWAFDVAPKGQKLHIICKSKSTFGKTTLGRITFQIDKVVTEGLYSGLFSLSHGTKKDSSSRSLEIEIIWTNKTLDDDDTI